MSCESLPNSDERVLASNAKPFTITGWLTPLNQQRRLRRIRLRRHPRYDATTVWIPMCRVPRSAIG